MRIELLGTLLRDVIPKEYFLFGKQTMQSKFFLFKLFYLISHLFLKITFSGEAIVGTKAKISLEYFKNAGSGLHLTGNNFALNHWKAA